MTASEILASFKVRNGWTEGTLLGLLLDFIDEVGSTDELDDYLAEREGDQEVRLLEPEPDPEPDDPDEIPDGPGEDDLDPRVPDDYTGNRHATVKE